MKILIADDDYTSRAVLGQLLRKLGHEVVETLDGEEAWEALQRPDAPRLAILDWIMPGLEGPEIVRRVRALPGQRVPYLIILTSRSGKEAIVEGLEAGADDYVSKPFDPGELRARVEVGRRMLQLQDSLLESRDHLAYQATHDALTGLPNRRAILDQLSRELARNNRQDGVLAVGMVDLDHFKQINDQYGHQTGDDCLCGLAHLMAESVRAYDSVGRIGGEEFLVILPLHGDGDGMAAFETLLEKIGSCILKTRSGPLTLTASIGVVCATRDSTVDEILEASDLALYEAKRAGRNRVVFYGKQPSIS